MKRFAVAAMLLMSSLSLVACKEQQAASKAGADAPTEVAVMTIQPRHLEISSELPGRTAAYRIAEVRPQVDGIIQKRLFEEGAVIEAGQPLYQIDPAPYQATLASAKADLQSAEAAVAAANARVARYNKLVKNDVVSRQNYDDAVAAQQQGKAKIAAAQAAIDAAEINLKRTRVAAPIAGRIGKSSVSEGALVTANQDQPLATVQQLDPIYVDMSQSARQLLRLRREIAAGQLQKTTDTTPVSLKLDRDTLYDHDGVLSFADVSVDEGTATVQLRAIFPNPDNQLLPGLFVRAVARQAVREHAILVPQRSLTRGADGRATVWVVDDQGVVNPRPVVTERAIGNAWLLASGLDGGERVVVAGLQKIRPGATVKATEQDLKIQLDLADGETASADSVR